MCAPGGKGGANVLRSTLYDVGEGYGGAGVGGDVHSRLHRVSLPPPPRYHPVEGCVCGGKKAVRGKSSIGRPPV